MKPVHRKPLKMNQYNKGIEQSHTNNSKKARKDRITCCSLQHPAIITSFFLMHAVMADFLFSFYWQYTYVHSKQKLKRRNLTTKANLFDLAT